MRLLDRSATILQLEELGLDGHKLELVDTLIHQSHGIVLVTGPTGSGKTTTLYAGLSRINTTDKNIITIEDPIEYQLHGVGQIQVNPKIELTFASGLRSILRQDPDVIMVGEIRDAGDRRDRHPGGAHRPPGVLDPAHQRLLRRDHPPDRHGHRAVPGRLVGDRRDGAAPGAPRLSELPRCRIARRSRSCASSASRPTTSRAATVYRPGPGCPECKHTGYRGRLGIHELLVVDDEVRNLIMKAADSVVDPARRRRQGHELAARGRRGEGAERADHRRRGPARHAGGPDLRPAPAAGGESPALRRASEAAGGHAGLRVQGAQRERPQRRRHHRCRQPQDRAPQAAPARASFPPT